MKDSLESQASETKRTKEVGALPSEVNSGEGLTLEPVIESRLNISERRNDTEYFISLLDPRFWAADRCLKRLLERRYGKNFEPIHVISNRVATHLNVDNYIVINSKLKPLLLYEKGINKVLMTISTELNEDFSYSPFVKKVILRLLERQDLIFINTYTTSFLDIRNDQVFLIGPNPGTVEYLDSKVNQRRFLEDLQVPVPSGRIYRDFASVEKAFEADEIGDCFISAEYEGGGTELDEVRSCLDLARFKARVRNRNLKKRFVVTEVIDSVSSPNSTAIVLSENSVFVVSISDQILDRYQYLGNIFPSKTSRAVQREIVECTREIGLGLAMMGYRGFFGCDFIVTPKEEFYVVDLNPRKQGGFLCNFLMWEMIRARHLPSLVELEMRALMESTEKTDLRELENPKLDFFWAHGKIHPAKTNVSIKKEIVEGSEEKCFEKIGSSFVESFFPKRSLYLGGHVLGQLVKTGLNYDELLKKIVVDIERYNHQILETHVGKVRTQKRPS